MSLVLGNLINSDNMVLVLGMLLCLALMLRFSSKNMRGVLEIFFDWYMIGVMLDGTDMPTLLLLGVCLETVWFALNGSFTHFNAT